MKEISDNTNIMINILKSTPVFILQQKKTRGKIFWRHNVDFNQFCTKIKSTFYFLLNGCRWRVRCHDDWTTLNDPQSLSRYNVHWIIQETEVVG